MNTSNNKLLRFGLYGEKDFLLPDFMHCESIEYRSKKNDWSIQRHLHTNLFQVFVIETGEVTFIFDQQSYHVNSPAIISIPENTLHALEVNRNIKGMVLTISSSFLETFFSSSPNVLIEVGSLKVLQHLKKENLFHLAVQMIHQIHSELQEDLPEKGLVLQSYFSLLLCSIYRLSIKHSEKMIPSDTQAVQYFRKFQRSVKQSQTLKKTIKAYARELNISPVHLNRVCQATTGKSALQVVHDFLFLEAKKFLKYTDYSIAEIAYRLNFEDPAYFSRFFSKQSGSSPKQFRANDRN